MGTLTLGNGHLFAVDLHISHKFIVAQWSKMLQHEVLPTMMWLIFNAALPCGNSLIVQKSQRRTAIYIH